MRFLAIGAGVVAVMAMAIVAKPAEAHRYARFGFGYPVFYAPPPVYPVYVAPPIAYIPPPPISYGYRFHRVVHHRYHPVIHHPWCSCYCCQ